MSNSLVQLIKVVKTRNRKGKDVIIKVLKDENTGNKFTEVIENPSFIYYLNAEKLDYPVDQVSEADVYEIECKYSDLFESMAVELSDYTDGKSVQDYKLYKDKKMLNSFKRYHLNPNIHGSDVDLEDYYIAKHFEEYPFENCKAVLTKAFFDIEVYTENYSGFPEPENADCPIDQIGYYDNNTKTFYGYLWNNPNIPSIKDFREPINLDNFIQRIKKKYYDKYNLEIIVELTWYDDELEMIRDFFDRVNINKPDFCGGWNSLGFDISYLINRTAKLVNQYNLINGENDRLIVEDIICDNTIPYAYQNLYIDTKANDFADNGSYFVNTSHINWVDQLLLFANLRKIFGKRESYDLDAIVSEELDEHKEALDPNNEGITIKNIVRKDYARYIEYNIHDVMLLHLLEEKNSDFDQLYSVASMTQTRIHKCLKKTVCLRNLSRKFNRDQGYISSNNHNAKYGNDGYVENTSFRGAYVGDPNLNEEIGKLIDNAPSKFVHENVIDFDLSSLYPSITLAFNISPSTLYGKVYFDDNIKNDEPNNQIVDSFSQKHSDETSDFFDKINSRDYINLCKDVFDLPTPFEMSEIIEKELNI